MTDIQLPKCVQFSIQLAVRGYIVVLCDEDGPIQSGWGSHSTTDSALEEAVEWAKAEDDLSLLPPALTERAIALGLLSAPTIVPRDVRSMRMGS